MIRRLTPHEVVFWWISPKPLYPTFSFYLPHDPLPFFSIQLNNDHVMGFDPATHDNPGNPGSGNLGTNPHLIRFQFGDHAHLHLATIPLGGSFPVQQKILYDVTINSHGQNSVAKINNGALNSHLHRKKREAIGNRSDLLSLFPHLCYPGEDLPSFMIHKKVLRFFHGSCRKPHHDSQDAMVGLDREVGGTLDHRTRRPAFLMLTGDQIYADDVAGPMLKAIHQVIDLLGIYPERFDGASVPDAHALYGRFEGYYTRKEILPRTRVGDHWYRRGGAKHIFSSSFAHNHLITFGEWMAMYLLVWSPVLWDWLSLESLEGVPAAYHGTYRRELGIIRAFQRSLPKVQRLLAHIPTYMIFDDHDVTDDWNLTAQWERQAYGHPFTKRIIGNGLMAYFLCQGLGNAPETFLKAAPLMASAHSYFDTPDKGAHDALIDAMLAFKHWHYEIPYSPELVVIDSRTRRWKRNRMPASPSGLLNWEALMKLQHKLMKSDAVLLVAPGPIFGVKLIELIQKIFTTFGYSLAVDAENWMAHRKSAYVLLEIFKNAKTASRNVIVSGDVHYSFAYDVELRHADACPGIWQITSSGIKNEFPGAILRWLDRINQVMYAPNSIFNIFTKRRDMVIYERTPKCRGKRVEDLSGKAIMKRGAQRLVNACGIGRVTLDDQGAPIEIAEVYADGSFIVFESNEQ